MRLTVIGHARSGTTVLQNALNTSPDIYLLGEAFLYRRGQQSSFRSWYNEQHVLYGNQPSKSTYARNLPGCDPQADGDTYLSALEHHYRIVGDKLALTYSGWQHDYKSAQAWLEALDVACIFVFRRPAEVFASTQAMFGPSNIPEYVEGLASVYRLYLDVAATLPNVWCLLHDNISAKTFAELGDALNVDLSKAFALYDRRAIKTAGVRWRAEFEPYRKDIEVIHNGIVQLHATSLRPDSSLFQRERKYKNSPSNNSIGAIRNLTEELRMRALQDIASRDLNPAPSSALQELPSTADAPRSA